MDDPYNWNRICANQHVPQLVAYSAPLEFQPFIENKMGSTEGTLRMMRRMRQTKRWIGHRTDLSWKLR